MGPASEVLGLDQQSDCLEIVGSMLTFWSIHPAMSVGSIQRDGSRGLHSSY